MRTEARVTEVTLVTTDHTGYAYKVDYRAILHEGKATRWLFYNIYPNRDLANYVKSGIEDQSIPIPY